MAEVVRAPRDDGDNIPNMAMTAKNNRNMHFSSGCYERYLGGTYILLSRP